MMGLFLLDAFRQEKKKKKASTSLNVFQYWNGSVAQYQADQGTVLLGCKGNNKKQLSTRGKE